MFKVRRPKTAILVTALLFAVVIIFWPARLPQPLKVEKPAARPLAVPPLSDLGKPAYLFHGISADAGSLKLDAHNLQRANQLNAPEGTVEQDVLILAEFIQTYARATGDFPAGDNPDITAALTGTQYPGQKGHIFPRQHNAIRSGQFVDRWGTPFWFHPNGPGRLEIRSAGPDKQMFTPDDIALNPSPPGLGVTPAQP